MKSPKIQLTLKPRQVEILFLLFRFRFLNRPQIQKLLNHKHHKNTISWLNQLTKFKYVTRYYDSTLLTEPAVYSLGKASKQYLEESGKIKYPAMLNRIKKEPHFRIAFRYRCIIMADVYLSVVNFANATGKNLTYYTKRDLYQFTDLMRARPDAYAALKPNHQKTHYFIELLTGPVTAIRRRVEQYVNCYDSRRRKSSPFPEVILICQTPYLKKSLASFISSHLEIEPGLNLYLVMEDHIKSFGLQKEYLERVI